MTFGLIDLATIVFMTAGAFTLALGMARYLHSLRDSRVEESTQDQVAKMLRDAEDRLGAMATQIEATQKAQIEALRNELAPIRENIDWLAGERMIDQAILMAREGISAEEISADLGMSHDAAVTVQAMRRH